MKLSLALVTLALTPFAFAGEEVVEDKRVEKELDSVLDKKVEFCQNYLGWVTTSTSTDYKYHTKTKTDYDVDVKWTTATFSKGATTVTCDPTTTTTTCWETKHPKVITKTFTDYKKVFRTTTKTKTIYLPKGHGGHKGKGHDHGKRGFDFNHGPDVKKYQRYHVSKACSKLLRKVEPKTRTYYTTTTVYKPTYTTTTIHKTITKSAKPVFVPKYTKTYTPTVTETVTKYKPRETIVKKAFTTVYVKVWRTQTVYTTKYYKKKHSNGKYDW